MAEQRFPNKVRLTPGAVEEVRKQGLRSTPNARIRMPAQKDDKDVYLTVGDEVDIKSLKGFEKFKPGRFIANIMLEKDTPIDPPVSLIIEITQEDVDRAQGGKSQIGYHDGKEWVPMGEAFTAQAGMQVEAPLSKVGDPPIAMSP